MKIQCLKSIIENLDPNSEIAIEVKRGADVAVILTYDIDYVLNEYGELVLSVDIIDSNKEPGGCLYESV